MSAIENVKAIFFDFDGTLADSYPAITSSVNYVRLNNGLPPLPEEVVRRFVGHGPYYLLENTVPSADPEKSLGLYREHHPEVMVAGTELLPGAKELLDALDAGGKRIALCSNKPRIYSQELLAHLGIHDKFEVVLGPEDVAQPKPAPDMLHEALRRLKIAVDEALYIGDMSVDIRTARGAGVTVWVVPTGSEDEATLRACRPDRLVQDLYEALQLLQ